MVQPAKTILTLLLVAVAKSKCAHANPCTSIELGVFNDVRGQVSKCLQDSKLNFLIPPRTSLTKTQQTALCKSKTCQEMIGSMDDLDIPSCEATFDNQNMTLQMSLDKFVSACDTATPAPSPIKRRSTFESDSSSTSGEGSSFESSRYKNAAAAVPFGSLQQFLVFAAFVFLSLGLPLF
ncbi:hypothetical protein CCR75_003059 [Bremia lactucae]|uniref:Elicitin n=1 Tax=Bremia lactucae TaxID=4779 RepID=A0A976IM59_BRELC|nr:hypothetical protein CCR75_003059 [Bremia lactucae]